MTSLIKQTLMEAPEEITLPSTSMEAIPGTSMSDDDFAPPMTQSPSKMPQAHLGSSTLKKEVINKEPVLAITSELKSVISTYEKKFEGEDLTIETATIYLNSLLETLAFYAEKIDALVNSEEQPEMPAPEIPDIAPEPADEPVTPLATDTSDFTNPVEPETPTTTNPLEALEK